MLFDALPGSSHGRPTALRASVPGAALLTLLLGAANPLPAGAGASLFDGLPPHWRDEDGHELQLAGFRGQRIIMTMAYTSCRKICPVTFARLDEMQHELDLRGEQAEVVVIGYDPDNDDPGAWRQYRASRHLTRANWHFLTGTRADTERLAHMLGFPFWKYDNHVMHEFRIVVFDRSGTLHAAVDSSRTDWRDAL